MSKRVAVIAAGQSKFGTLGKSMKELFIDALKDCELNTKELLTKTEEVYIGNLGVGGSQLGNPAALLIEHGLRTGISAQRVENACASSGFAFRDAYRAIRSGAKVSIAGGVEVMNDLSPLHQKYWLGVSGDTEWERLAGATFAGIYALMAKRHMYEYGTTKEMLASIAVKNHRNAINNPKAQFHKEISLEMALNSPLVADPLGLFDCCPTSDGASVVFLASEEVARKYTDEPIWVTGSGAATDFLALHDRPLISEIKATQLAMKQAINQAEIKHSEIDFAEVHDCFTIAELLAMEDLGFYDKGEAGDAILRNDTGIDGTLPINVSGGLKAKGHPLGATGTGQIVEIFNQLTENAGKRQLKNVQTGLAHNVGGSGATCTVHILRRE